MSRVSPREDEVALHIPSIQTPTERKYGFMPEELESLRMDDAEVSLKSENIIFFLDRARLDPMSLSTDG
jgi:hypothetical protein